MGIPVALKVGQQQVFIGLDRVVQGGEVAGEHVEGVVTAGNHVGLAVRSGLGNLTGGGGPL